MSKVKILIFVISILVAVKGVSQKPTITSVDKIAAAYSDILTIKGTEFGTEASRLKVNFGPVTGTIKSVSNQLLEVSVPAGATFENFSVVNTVSGLAGYSTSPLLLSFGGTQNLAAASFATEYQKAADIGLYDLALGDFNGDNLTDVICTSDQFNALAIMYNGSTPATLNFTKSNDKLLSNIKTLHITTGDLNGDGKLDIVASEGNDGNRIVVYKNNGNLNWSITSIALAGRKVKRVAIADLDLDGKPEIIVTDKGSNIISILPNQSTVANISFAAAKNLIVTDAITTDALEIKDLNGDGSPEIITSQFIKDDCNIFVCSNKSTLGNFSFNDITTIKIGSAVISISVGDLDGDKKPDLVATRYLSADIAVFKNASTKTQFAFGEAQLYTTGVRPWGIDLGDLNGDGKIDVAVSSLDITTNNQTLAIFANTSSDGTISLSNKLSIKTQYINRHVKIADMDGDAKPDIVFASVDDNAGSGGPASKISILRNKSCLQPKINPEGPLTVCNGYPLTLNASNSPGTQYEWKNEATPLSAITSQLAVTATGKYTVKATSESGSCQATSNSVSVTVSAASSTLTGTPSPSSNSPICTGSPLQLVINDVGGSEYRWSGPNGYSATGLSATKPGFTNENAGVYSIDIIKGGTLASGGCIAKTITLAVQNIDVPTFNISYSGGDVLCSGTTKILGLSPVLTSGFTYQWFDASGAISGSTNSTITINKTGEYYAKIKSSLANCDAQTTSSAKISVLSLPVPAFSVAPSPVCSGTSLTFSNQSVTDSKVSATYSWKFGDNTTSDLVSPVHTYATGTTYPVILTVDYTGVTGCAVTSTKNLQVFATAKPVFSPANLNLCKDETKTLSVAGSFLTFTWSTGGTGSSISISQPGKYSVTTGDQNGCLSTAQLTVELKPDPVVTISADKTLITPGETVQLISTGADTYAWTPVETLDNPSIANPKAKPIVNTTYVVKGSVNGGCSAEKSIDIMIEGDAGTLKVTNVFTPNGDGHNDLWVINGIENYQDCTLSLFDKNGSKVFEQKGYKNDWDGNYKGLAAPEGTYYFVLVCAGSKPLTGNLLLVR